MEKIKFDEKEYIILFARLAIAIAFISAVMDRFGLWGNPGDNNVAWGNFQLFEEYVAYLNPLFSQAFVSIVSWFVTIVEIILAVMLLVGYKTRLASLLSALLLFIFALSMTIIMGIKVPLDYSVLSASAAAFLLYILLKEKSIA